MDTKLSIRNMRYLKNQDGTVIKVSGDFRKDILKYIELNGPATTRTIATYFKKPEKNISKHLIYFYDRKLLDKTREGVEVFYKKAYNDVSFTEKPFMLELSLLGLSIVFSFLILASFLIPNLFIRQNSLILAITINITLSLGSLGLFLIRKNELGL